MVPVEARDQAIIDTADRLLDGINATKSVPTHSFNRPVKIVKDEEARIAALTELSAIHQVNQDFGESVSSILVERGVPELKIDAFVREGRFVDGRIDTIQYHLDDFAEEASTSQWIHAGTDGDIFGKIVGGVASFISHPIDGTKASAVSAIQTPENALLAYRSFNLSAQNYLVADFSAGEFYLNDANEHLLAAELGALNAYTLGRSGSILSSGVSTLNQKYIVGVPFRISTTTNNKGVLTDVPIERDLWGNEIFYRSMPLTEFNFLTDTGRLSASTLSNSVETSVASWSRYSSTFRGDAFVRLTARRGTVAKLEGIGLAGNEGTRALQPHLALRSGSWNQTNAVFKLEGRQISMQLGAQGGDALRIFNNGLIKSKPVNRTNEIGKPFRAKNVLDKFIDDGKIK